MIQQSFNDIYTDELAQGAIINNEFPGFKEDYLILHCLLRKYKPDSVFEIGCNRGTGTCIIKNALPDADVYSLDLPFNSLDKSLKHGNKDLVGINCNLPFTLLRGDSMTFDFSKYPCEAYYIDGNHAYDNVGHETIQALKNKPIIVIYHDFNIPEVMAGVLYGRNDLYDLYHVKETRIAYLLKI